MNNQEPDYLFVTGNGYDHLEPYLEKLYGQRASFKINLDRFLRGEEFQNCTKFPNSMEDIQTISPDSIKRTIERNDIFHKRAMEICDLFDRKQTSRTLTEEDVLYIGGVLGIAPGMTDRADVLFPDLVDLYISSVEEGNLIEEKVINNLPVLESAINQLLDRVRQNQIIRYNGRDLVSQGYARYYYRGENAYYKKSNASIFRQPLSEKYETREIQLLISQLRIVEFSRWLNRLTFIKHWPYGDIAHGAIAQHYGIATNAIDITSDLRVALFFACCKYVDDEWRPLEPKDFEEKDSRRNVARIGGDSRYGILFHTMADICDMSRFVPDYQPHITQVTPLGAQPFLRCQKQSGYVIESGELPGSNKPFDMYQALPFCVVKFRHTRELCDWIYEEMDQGKLIYPEYNCVSLNEVVEEIKTTKVFEPESLVIAMQSKGININRLEELRNKLCKMEITFKDQITRVSDDYIEMIENAWAEANYPKLNISPRFKFGFCL